MARAKKEAALTPEERLQAALVPDWEWPYKLPENWCWTNWGECGEFVAGSGFKNEYQGFTNYDIPFYKVSSLKTANETGYLCDNTNTVDETVRKKLKAALIPANSLLFAKIGEAIRLNRRAINTVPCCVDNNMMAFVPIICQLKYAFYWSKGIDLYDFTNATTVPAIRKTDLEKISFPLAPLAEQQRIVDRIESLFAKLDEAKEKAQDVVDSFEIRKAAILHKAFTGELTAKWREEHGVGMESWEKYKFNELGTLERGRSKHRPRNDPKLFGGKYPFIQTGDVARSGMYITEHTQTLSEVGAEQSKLFPKGTLCITIAANIGDVSILTYDCCFPDSVVGFTPNERTLSEYIYYLMSTLQREIEANAPATAQKNINLRILNDLQLDIPSVAEQTQIVNQVEYLFFQEQHAKEAAEAVLEQIDLMKKSILARAFRGELGTNDPSEESAAELLKRALKRNKQYYSKIKWTITLKVDEFVLRKIYHE